MHSTYVRNFANTAVLVITSFIIVGVAFGVISRNVFLYGKIFHSVSE